MALANGVSKIKTSPLTSHTQTAIVITELLTKAKFTVTPVDNKSSASNGACFIECTGIGHKNPHFA